MYRTNVKGQEVFIKLSAKLVKEKLNRTQVYEAVLRIAESLIEKKEQSSFALFEDKIGMITGEVVRGNIVVFYVDHIITRQNIYKQENLDFLEEGANF
ncbi:cytoplasmic protein [Bacillus sp. 165]|uniref:cytoplasmic protein n=1 Tax=Bacillus sp. 165 TaxID=1529117 RepID=UPI001ADC5440|nr:cytoplasmic protein [Bacillus sp. 165]MBO9128174.1 cytoplasmic protein [Bacillus sp. 165]